MDHFGATEFGLPIGNHNAIAMAVKPGSMGLPAPGQRMAVVDESGRAAAGRRGRADRAAHATTTAAIGCATGTTTAATARLRRGDWICTGDLARRDRGRLLLVRGPLRRHHQELRLPDRSVRDRKRDPHARRRRRGRRRRRARSAARPGRQGVRGAAARRRALGRGSPTRSSRLVKSDLRQAPVSARDRDSSMRCPRPRPEKSSASCFGRRHRNARRNHDGLRAHCSQSHMAEVVHVLARRARRQPGVPVRAPPRPTTRGGSSARATSSRRRGRFSASSPPCWRASAAASPTSSRRRTTCCRSTTTRRPPRCGASCSRGRHGRPRPAWW